jgi:cobalt-zinc-cadmium efflux system outer membrane protein
MMKYVPRVAPTALLPGCAGLLLLPLLLSLLPAWAVATEDATPSLSTEAMPALAPDQPLSLPAAEALLRQRSRSLALARTAVAAARAGIEQAGARPNPVVSWTGQHLRPGRSAGTQALDQVVAFSDTWERGDKRALRLAQADAAHGAAQADAVDAGRQALLALRQAWADLLLAEQREALRARTAQTYEHSLAAAKKRVDAGDLAGADLARLRVDAERAFADAGAAQADRRRAQIALASQLALEPEAARLHTDGQWPVPPPPMMVDDIDQRLDARPDVRSARLAVEVASKAYALAEAQRHRDVTWSVLAERDRASGLGTTVGLGVAVPLLWGNDYSGDMHHAMADLTAAQQRLDMARAMARSDVQQAQSDLDAARALLARFEGGLTEAAQRAADAAEFAYSHGALGVMDLLDARRTLQTVQNDALAARDAVANAAAALDAALGAGLAP